MNKWLNFNFELERKEDFVAFVKDIKKFIKKRVGRNYKFTGFKPNHFTTSGFITNIITGKIVYLSFSDVRFEKDWITNILIRKASSTKDYTGERNQYSSLLRIDDMIKKLTN